MAAEIKKIKLETLSPVHIGSGEIFQKGFDYIVTAGRNEEGVTKSKIYFIDIEGIGKLINNDRNVTINDWITAINEKNQNFLNRFGTQAYSKKIDVEDIKVRNQIVGCMLDSNGTPYIPGSSIKGAIRTVIFSDLAIKDKNLIESINKASDYSKIKDLLNDWYKKIFGEPENDFLKNLLIGDVYFPKNSDVETIINQIRFKKKTMEGSLTQTLQVINIGADSTFRIINKGKYLDPNKSNQNEGMKYYNDFLNLLNQKGLSYLFNLINETTLRLIDSLIDSIPEQNPVFEKSVENSKDFLNCLNILKEDTKACKIKGDKCILRIGQGSGWEFITGGWEKKLSPKALQIILNKNYNKNPQASDFPVTFWADDFIEPLGFCKLSMID